MHSHDADLIGLGWIPNISGDITTVARLDECFKALPSDSNYAFDLDRTQKCVVVTKHTDMRITLMVKFIDDSGLCYIYNMNETKFRIDYGSEGYSEMSYCVMSVWKELLRTIDCCSSSLVTDESELRGAEINCICNAMDWPIPFDDSLVDKRFELILDEFISKIENQSDSARHIKAVIRKDYFGNEKPQSIKDRMDGENRLLATQSTNAIYMESFISLYSEYIGDVSKYQSVNELRSRKLKTISVYNTNSAQIDNLCLSSKSIRITRWGVLIAAVAFCLNIVTLLLSRL